MKIGLTFDLRSQYLAEGYSEEQTAEMDREETIDALADALEDQGHTTVRIGNARNLVDKLASGARWDLVFNICEGLHGLAREAQVPALLDAFNLPYTFSDPLVLSLCMHKGMTKAVMLRAGVPTSDFCVVESMADLPNVLLPFPAFVKPIAEGTGKGITSRSKVTNRIELAERCADLLQSFTQPVLVEPFLSGREFTVSLLGSGISARVLGTLEIILLEAAEPDVYSYANKERSEELVECRYVSNADPTVKAAEVAALAAWRALGCRDAGRVDLRCDASGKPLVMEINPLAGLHPTHSDLPLTATAVGMTFQQLVRNIVEQAASRVAAVSTVSQKPEIPSPHFDVQAARKASQTTRQTLHAAAGTSTPLG